MADAFIGMGQGFLVALTPQNIYYCLLGCLFGTVVGVLPGVGPLAGISLLLPATFGMAPVSALIMLCGIYYGAMYGGSTTSILMNIPGEAASVVTCLDGYQMGRKGRAGAALFIAAWGSFLGGNLSILGIALLAPALAQFAVRFGPAEMFAIMVLAMLLVGYVGSGSALKSLGMILLGLFLGTVGMDTMTGYMRMTFGLKEMADGIGFIPVAMGLFGISEILLSTQDAVVRAVVKPRLRELPPSRDELRRSWGPIGRGAVLGFFLGLLPGAAHIIAGFSSYALEKKLADRPEEFGTGRIEGVAGPETANNAATGGAMIPFLSLGIPSGPATAVMMVALLIHGIKPGPLLIQENPEVFWGVVASMYLGNVVLLILNLPMVGLFVNLLRVPFRLLFPMILTICLVGVYSVNASVTELWIMLVAGVAGFVLRKLRFDVAPLVLALILGPMMELAFRQSLMMSGGDFTVFVGSPIAVTLLSVSLLLGLGSVARPLLAPPSAKPTAG
jgi:putative tricarboxylic transport membrane protein